MYCNGFLTNVKTQAKKWWVIAQAFEFVSQIENEDKNNSEPACWPIPLPIFKYLIA